MCEEAWSVFEEYLRANGMSAKDVASEPELRNALNASTLTTSERATVAVHWQHVRAPSPPGPAEEPTLACAYAAVDSGRLAEAWATCQRLLSRGRHRVAASLLASALHRWCPRACTGPHVDREALWRTSSAPGVRQDEARRDFDLALRGSPVPGPTERFAAAMYADFLLDDLGLAMDTLRRAGSHAGALYHLGSMYQSGRHPGGVKDPEEAKRYYQLALRVGRHAMAANNYAALLNEDSLNEEDEQRSAELAREAFAYFRMAARDCESIALYNLGRRMSYGVPGFVQDVRAAVAALQEAERLGDADAAAAISSFEAVSG
eukprot:m51a1_g3675 hypothetical protein (319) ;mRNA; f:286127-287155